jgi:hypothetical protein
VRSQEEKDRTQRDFNGYQAGFLTLLENALFTKGQKREKKMQPIVALWLQI